MCTHILIVVICIPVYRVACSETRATTALIYKIKITPFLRNIIVLLFVLTRTIIQCLVCYIMAMVDVAAAAVALMAVTAALSASRCRRVSASATRVCARTAVQVARSVG